MKRLFATFVALAAAVPLATSEIPDTFLPSGPKTNAPASIETSSVPIAAPTTVVKTAGAKPAKIAHASAPTAQALAQMQVSLDQLTKSNHDLLDLLKQQQAVLEDIQYDRRLQSRQIDSARQRLEEALDEKQQLERKVDSLETQASVHPIGAAVPPSGLTPDAPIYPPSPAPNAPVISSVPSPDSNPTAVDTPPAPPASYLPPEGTDDPPGPQKWHRLFTLKGNDNQQTDVFTVHGKVWRVLWHNQDKVGKLYANTSALFINAFPRDDTIPTQVCSKLGTGGGAAGMRGAGNYYLKLEASGGSWEIAVEDLQ